MVVRVAAPRLPGISHQDRFHPLTVGQLVHGLGSQASIGFEHVAAGDGREPVGIGQGRP